MPNARSTNGGESPKEKPNPSEQRTKKSDNPKNGEDGSRPLVTKITALHTTFKKRRKAHRKAIRSDIVEAVEIGLAMQKDPKQWEYFCENCWKTGGPNAEKIAQAVRYTIKFMTGPGKSAQKKASFYYNAVKLSVDKGISGKALKKLLRTEGLKKLADEHAQHKKEMRGALPGGKHGSPASTKQSTVAPVAKAANNADQIKSKTEKTSKEAQKKSAPSKASGFDWPVVLRFDDFNKRLTNMKIGEKVRFTAKLEKMEPTAHLLVSKTKRLGAE